MSAEPIPAKRPRKRPRLTLGVMMLIVLALGAWMGWIAHRARVQREAVAAIVRAGGEVTYDYQNLNDDAKPPGPAWLRRLIGRDYFDTVWGVSGDKPAVDDAVVAQIGKLTEIRWLGLQGSTVTDSGLSGLASLHELRTVHFHAPNVDGSGFRHLAGLRKLKNLHLSGMPITDENLATLGPLKSIENFSLVNTRVGDAGMTQVANLPGLKKFWLGSANIGDEGLRELGRTGRPIRIFMCSKTRITAEGIDAMKANHPEMTITP